MTVHGLILFLHVGFAILLVGGSLWIHVAHGSMRRARTVDGSLTQARFIAQFSKAGGPLAAGTFLAGAYLTTVGGLWGDGWLIVSLTLFLLAGAGFATVLDPGSARQLEILTAAPEGPMSTATLDALHDRRYETVMTVLAGADAAILFLMTNKPGLLVSLGVAAIGLTSGMVVAVRHGRRASATPPPPMPAV